MNFTRRIEGIFVDFVNCFSCPGIWGRGIIRVIKGDKKSEEIKGRKKDNEDFSNAKGKSES